MYFFLSILSLADICFISTTVPQMIVGIQTQSRVISYVGCLTQMSLFLFFLCKDDMLLTVMAYDRFVAICHPLHYPVIMNPNYCCCLVLVASLFSLLDSQVHNLIALQFTCFKIVETYNFFCDPSLLLNLSCSEFLTNSSYVYYWCYIWFVPNLNDFYLILQNCFFYSENSIINWMAQSILHLCFSSHCCVLILCNRSCRVPWFNWISLS
jgi:hypothetical protein